MDSNIKSKNIIEEKIKQNFRRIMTTIISKNSFIKLSIIIFLSLIIDNLFIYTIQNPPAWDQGYHLSNYLKCIIF